MSLPTLAETHEGRQSWRARWVFPVGGPPLERGVLEENHGRITAVHDRPGPVTLDLGNAALIPGLINAHTHLELSDVAEPLGPRAPFTAWLQAVMAHRRGRSGAEASRQAVRAGAEESLQAGTTFAGDIVSADWDRADLVNLETRNAKPETQAGPRGVAFLELLGLDPGNIPARLEQAERHLRLGAAARKVDSDRWSPGLSPHAPYSVHPDLFAKLVDLAARHRVPLAMHLAETRGELELLADGTGEFVSFLERLGVWRPDVIPRGSRPLDYLRRLASVPRALAIHGNYFAEDEIDFLAGCDNISVVYCPRTHAWFGHAPHPWQAMLARGINVALGTDSRASTPDLSVWNELMFLRRQHPDVPPATWLELGTRGGALALGREATIGKLSPGMRADLTVVTLPPVESSDPHELLFHPASRVTGTILGQ